MVVRRCCVWDKPLSPLSTPPWLWDELPPLSALGILGMPERDTQIPVTIRGMPVSHKCLIWGLQSSTENKMQLPPSRTCKLFGKKIFFRVFMFSEKKEEINGVFFPSSHLGFYDQQMANTATVGTATSSLHVKLTLAPRALEIFWIFISFSGGEFIIYELLRSCSIFRLFLSSPRHGLELRTYMKELPLPLPVEK